MRARTTLPDPIAALLVRQSGVIARTQALDGGLSVTTVQSLVRRGAWVPLTRGVYVANDGAEVAQLQQTVRLSRPMDRRTRGRERRDAALTPGVQAVDQCLWAGVLAGGSGASLGGAASAYVLGLVDRFDHIDVWSPLGEHRRSRRESLWRFHRGVRTGVGSPPHTSIEETILDLASGDEADNQSHWLSVALSSGRTSPQRLLDTLERMPCLPGRRQLVEVLDMVAGGAHSPLEVRFLRDVERPHRLPVAARQQSISRGTRSDMVHEEYRLVIELDGLAGHRGRFELRDGWRDVEHLGAGFATLRFGWSDVVRRPCQVAAAVGRVLNARGWPGQVRPCRQCPRGSQG